MQGRKIKPSRHTAVAGPPAVVAAVVPAFAWFPAVAGAPAVVKIPAVACVNAVYLSARPSFSD